MSAPAELPIPIELRIGTRGYQVLRHVPATDKIAAHLVIRGHGWPAGSSPTVYPWPPRLHLIDRTEAGTAFLVSKVTPSQS